MKRAHGRLDGDVFVDDTAAANRIHNKGSFGTPQSGNTLRLSRVEAAYCVQQGRLRVDVPFAELLAGVDVAYLAFADLRDRGLVVRHDGDAFLVWRRGDGPKQEPWFRFHTAAERDPITAADLAAWHGGIVGVVDEDGAVTHYRVDAAAPEGTVMAVDLPPLTGAVLDDRVLATGPGAAACHQEAIGTPHGDAVILSFTEAEALRRRGVLDVPELTGHARQRQHHFDRTLPVYLDLRRRGVVARSGFRFGTHLRGYRADPDTCHAEWLVQCAEPAEVLHWSELSRAVRLAHGVRKTFLLASDDPVQYTALAWFRP